MILEFIFQMVIFTGLPTITTSYILFDENQAKYPDKNHLPSLKQSQDDAKIIFPDSEEEDGYSKCPQAFTDELVPECGADDFYCDEETAKNYPLKNLKCILKNKAMEHADLFRINKIIPMKDRIEDNEKHSLCEAIEMTIYPQIATNRYNRRRFIINQEPFRQAVRVKKCLKQRQGFCTVLGKALPGYRVSCEQEYTFKTLVSLSDDYEQIIDEFKFPSGCCCAQQKLNVLQSFNPG